MPYSIWANCFPLCIPLTLSYICFLLLLSEWVDSWWKAATFQSKWYTCPAVALCPWLESRWLGFSWQQGSCWSGGRVVTWILWGGSNWIILHREHWHPWWKPSAMVIILHFEHTLKLSGHWPFVNVFCQWCNSLRVLWCLRVQSQVIISPSCMWYHAYHFYLKLLL